MKPDPSLRDPRTAPFARMARDCDLFLNPRRSGAPPNILTPAGHKAAIAEISSWREYHPTPLFSLGEVARDCVLDAVWYKDEALRFGLGSFKALGGAYAVLRVLQREALRRTGRAPSSGELRARAVAQPPAGLTVTTATDGNHGRSVAWGARMFGCRSVVYVPKACSRGREAAIAQYGARVIRTGAGYDETVRLCAAEAAERGWVVVSDTSWPGYVDIPRDVMDGYTVLVEEALRQLSGAPSWTHVFVQGGVGGLAASVCAHLSNRLGAQAPDVIVVEPKGAACLFASARAGKPVSAPPPVGTIMAGLDCAEVSTLAWEVLHQAAAAFMTVTDAVVAPSMRLLAGISHDGRPIVAGESAVAGLAAVLIASNDPALRNTLRLDANSRVLVIGTEGATDPEIYRSLVTTAPPL